MEAAKGKGNWDVCDRCNCQWSYTGKTGKKDCKDGVKKSVKKKADCKAMKTAAEGDGTTPGIGWDAVCASMPTSCKNVKVMGIKMGKCCFKGCVAN